ncbi:MAG: hypothetical protein AAGB46_08190 [Verrucomicrobiota bacterium]
MDDDDGDGLSNFYEYGVGGDPTNKSSLGGTPKVIHGESGEVLFSTVQLIDRANLPIRYTVLHCTDLESGDWTPFADDGTIINDLPGSDEYEEVQYRLSISGDESHEIFLRLSVEETQ